MSKPSLSAGRPSSRKSKVETLASLADAAPVARVNFEISQDLHRKLKMHAAKEGKTIKDMLTAMIQEVIE